MKKVFAYLLYACFSILIVMFLINDWLWVYTTGWTLALLLLIASRPFKPFRSGIDVARLCLTLTSLAGAYFLGGENGRPDILGLSMAVYFLSTSFLIWLIPCQFVRVPESAITTLDGVVLKPGAYVWVWPHNTRSLQIRPYRLANSGVIDTSFEEIDRS